MVVADYTIYDDIHLDVLLVPSAYDMDDYLRNKDLIGFIQKHQQAGNWLASNCSGRFFLAKQAFSMESQPQPGQVGKNLWPATIRL